MSKSCKHMNIEVVLHILFHTQSGTWTSPPLLAAAALLRMRAVLRSDGSQRRRRALTMAQSFLVLSRTARRCASGGAAGSARA